MELQAYIDKVLKERKRVYLENAKNASTHIFKSAWLNAYNDISIIIYELEGLLKGESESVVGSISVDPYRDFDTESGIRIIR